MPSEDYHMERYHAHKKWEKYHGIITGLSIASIFGILWAWLFAIKWWQHRKKAKSEKRSAETADS